MRFQCALPLACTLAAAVFVIAQKKDDGSYTAAGVTAEKDGVKPPM